MAASQVQPFTHAGQPGHLQQLARMLCHRQRQPRLSAQGDTLPSRDIATSQVIEQPGPQAGGTLGNLLHLFISRQGLQPQIVQAPLPQLTVRPAEMGKESLYPIICAKALQEALQQHLGPLPLKRPLAKQLPGNFIVTLQRRTKRGLIRGVLQAPGAMLTQGTHPPVLTTVEPPMPHAIGVQTIVQFVKRRARPLALITRQVI
ncbi:hypothetical protein WR25_17532 [Diploscapter pachys]|uniref:Uncharacterized protein n=1 Tax=Diploscapter pachys TaxID=2018661 RepID=A0A2A2KCV6_9BILA|nr:hypothetical protein WR25_17532 [Diploscapter pachys]